MSARRDLAIFGAGGRAGATREPRDSHPGHKDAGFTQQGAGPEVEPEVRGG